MACARGGKNLSRFQYRNGGIGTRLRELSSRLTSDIGREKGERFVIMITAALAIWNVIALVMGVIANWMDKRGLLRL